MSISTVPTSRRSLSRFEVAFERRLADAMSGPLLPARPHCERLGLPPEAIGRSFSGHKLAGALLRGRPRLLLAELRRLFDGPPSEKKARALLSPELTRWSRLYDALSDDQSRNLLVDLLVYRMLGYRRIRLPLDTPAYWKSLEDIENAMDKDDVVATGFLDWRLHRINTSRWGWPIDLYSSPVGVLTQFVNEQYFCRDQNNPVTPASGDVVIDCGVCYGDTVLQFAAACAPNGRVFGFEFAPSNLVIAEQNLALNPSLAERIELIRHPVWSESGTPLYVSGAGPATRVSSERRSDGMRCETLSIDDFVNKRNLDRVDFIKMDVEGAELHALRGAAETIKTFKPNLAICVYHNLMDFIEIPEYISSLVEEYELKLRHYTVYLGETVLFASLPKR